ncbi:hypothetical protein BN165_1600024 [Clostridioides difficile E1]|nr:hypothetical protein BN163_1680024 [Clostridioides difficile T5]CCK91799.1 hypothetical protein BN164_1560024 [Clostridioides difficile T20]CCK95509.1 hypothetical protein BN165_1600024 [Clostridioides difficile E1]CCK99497.1 hypothetical protein BN166_2110024 [Clostridioides difficile E10]
MVCLMFVYLYKYSYQRHIFNNSYLALDVVSDLLRCIINKTKTYKIITVAIISSNLEAYEIQLIK